MYSYIERLFYKMKNVRWVHLTYLLWTNSYIINSAHVLHYIHNTFYVVFCSIWVCEILIRSLTVPIQKSIRSVIWHFCDYAPGCPVVWSLRVSCGKRFILQESNSLLEQAVSEKKVRGMGIYNNDWRETFVIVHPSIQLECNNDL